MRLILASYNIHSCVGTDRRYDPSRIVQVLHELRADIVALQEVDSRDHHGLELLGWIAERLRMHPLAGPTLLRHTGHYGNALLTKHPTADARHINLSLPGLEPRGAIDADVVCEGILLRVIATHLGLRPAERRVQIQQLLNRCRDEPCVLMGDLNEWFLWGRPLRWLTALFGRTPHLRTCPAWWPLLALYRISVRPPHALLKLEVHKSPLAQTASDHLPLKGVLKLKS